MVVEALLMVTLPEEAVAVKVMNASPDVAAAGKPDRPPVTCVPPVRLAKP